MIAFPYTPLRRPEKLHKKPDPVGTCEHEWQWFKERIRVDDDGKKLTGGHKRQFDSRRQFWFKTRACVKCKKKIRTGLYHETV